MNAMSEEMKEKSHDGISPHKLFWHKRHRTKFKVSVLLTAGLYG